MNKRVLIISIILIFIVIILIILTNIINSPKEYTDIPEDVEMDKYVYDATYQIKKEENVASYITVNNCIDIYLDYVRQNNSNGILGILNDNYKKIEGINAENVLEKIEKINGECKYNADCVYSYDVDFFFNIYIVKGKLINTADNLIEEHNYILNIDNRRRTFEITPLDDNYKNYINYKDDKLNEIDKDLLENKERKIESNDYNEANLAIGIGEKEVLNYYFSQFKMNIMYDLQNAYNMLNDDYKEKRFGNYENFVQYVKDNSEAIEKSLIIKYRIEEFDDYKEYLCIDNFNNIFIFLEKEPMNYSVLLDEYTLQDKIIEKQYKQSNKKEKAQMNLDSFMQMLNRSDLEAAYNVLDEQFKEKYFNNIDEFKNYINNNLFKYNEFKYEEVTEKNSETIKVKTKINDKLNNSNVDKIKRFVVKLLENDKFSISFDI